MRIKTCALQLMVILSISHSLASEYTTATTSTGYRLDNLIPSATPFPGGPHGNQPSLELRQNLGEDLNPTAVPAGAQLPPVTVYTILSQADDDAAKVVMLTYTQTFDKVPDQFPQAKEGQIGMGTLHRKREATPTPIVNTGYTAHTFVLAMETVMIAQPMQRVTDVLVMETWTVNVRNSTAVQPIGTGQSPNVSRLATFGTATPLLSPTSLA